MVVESGVYPYGYHQGGTDPSGVGRFQIPLGHEGLISPSAIHFEEAMYVAKSEYNRIHKESGHRSANSPMPPWYSKSIGRFQLSTNVGNSGQFDPNPSGAFLDGTLKLDIISNDGFMPRSVNIPAEVQSEEYIAQLRELIDDYFEELGDDVGPWDDIFATFPNGSGVKRDWLTIYKNYTDEYAESGLWYLENELLSEDQILPRMPSGIITDRHLDEVRMQPIPTLSRNNGGTSVQFFNNDAQFAQYGWQEKQVTWNRRPIRPVYLLTDGNLPSGWVSGIQINYDFQAGSPDRPSGVGTHMTPGMQLALSGDGVWTTLSGVYISDLDNETRPDSPAACRFQDIQPSGKSAIPSGQHRIMITNPGDPVSFPWGSSGTPHLGAIWPFTSTYEPDDGRQVSSATRFYDITLENQSFWITDHCFIYRNNNGKDVGNTPHLNSGMFWLMDNSGPSNHTNVIDAWNMDGTPNSGTRLLFGNAKYLGSQASADSFSWVFGGGWAYNRTTDDYMIVGRSGTTGAAPTRASGIFGRWDQNMTFATANHFGSVIITGALSNVRWHISEAFNNAYDGTDWIINGNVVSGLHAIGSSGVPKVHSCWARVDSTNLILKDAIIGPTIGWANYLRSNSEYITLDRPVLARPDEVPGATNAEYKTVVPTWGTLVTDTSGAPDSGSFSSTTYNLTYASAMSGIINIANSTAKSRVHICKFFETEPDNDVYCSFIAFSVGESSGISDTPDIWIGKLDSSSHPFEMTDAWMVQGLGTTYANVLLAGGFGIAHGDCGSFDHMEIHGAVVAPPLP